MSIRLYAGNLSFDTNPDDLQNLFPKASFVREASVVQDRVTGKSRGFAFVTMSSDEEAQTAVTKFNGCAFQGCKSDHERGETWRSLRRRAPRLNYCGCAGVSKFKAIRIEDAWLWTPPLTRALSGNESLAGHKRVPISDEPRDSSLNHTAGGLLVRIFTIFDDCTQNSFFRSRTANQAWGFITGVLCFTSYHHWNWEHTIHHAHAGDLDSRGLVMYGRSPSRNISGPLALPNFVRD